MSILRAHLDDHDGGWPVHRGLERLASMLLLGGSFALLYACQDGRSCHRAVIAEALNARHFAGALTLREVVDRRI